MSLPTILRVLFLFSAGFVLTSCSKVTIESNENFQSVTLPDNSEILLNRNSSIQYDKEFDPREIKLEGEAFFNVASNGIPFVVSTPHGEIAVLGTEFNVKTAGENLEVEVEKGIVEVKTNAGVKKIKRGGRVVYNKSRNTIKKGKAEFKFRIWLSELRVEFKKLGKEIKWNGKKAGKEFKKMGKDIKREFK